jgi:hypothetical protein
MMELRNSIGFIGRMNPLIISMGKISFLDPIVQYSTIPPFQLHVVKLMGHPSGVKPMPGPLGQDSLHGFSNGGNTEESALSV